MSRLLFFYDLEADAEPQASTDVALAYAAMLINLLPPGKVWRLVESQLRNLFLGSADELARLHVRIDDLLDEADPTTIDELLAEAEAELSLDATGTNAERVARVVARTIARQRYRPVDIQAALAPLADVAIIENSHATAVALGDVREIYRFFCYNDPLGAGPHFIASAQALLDQIKPSHTLGFVIESLSMLYDDPHSLYDRDVLGA